MSDRISAASVFHGGDPKVWGPVVWRNTEREIEALPAAQDVDPRNAIEAKMHSLVALAVTLPCGPCRENYVEHAATAWAAMQQRHGSRPRGYTRAALHYFWWKVHDLVNKHNKKPETYRAAHDWEWYKHQYPGART